MQEITLTVDELALLQTKDFYTDADMSLVNQEWATFVMQFIQYSIKIIYKFCNVFVLIVVHCDQDNCRLVIILFLAV